MAKAVKKQPGRASKRGKGGAGGDSAVGVGKRKRLASPDSDDLDGEVTTGHEDVEMDEVDDGQVDGEEDGEQEDGDEEHEVGTVTPSSIGMARRGGGRGGETPSTAATSVSHYFNEKTSKPTVASSTKKTANTSSARATPKRASAQQAAGKLKLPRYESDLETESGDEVASSADSQRFRQLDDDSEDEVVEEEEVVSSEGEESEEEQPKGKGKGRARAKVEKNKGKRKRVATSDESAVEQDGSDVESQMVRAAIEASLKQSKPSKAGSSSGPAKHSFTLVVGKKASNKQGLARKVAVKAVNDRISNTLPKNGKGKGRRSAKVTTDDESEYEEEVPESSAVHTGASLAPSSEDDDSSDLSAVDSDEEEEVKPARRRRAVGAKRVKKERKTWWQKNQDALEKHHPELRDVWGDLKRNVAVVTPEKAVQPEGLTRKLLPFQLEGLAWMTKQEKGPWAGGMLADEMGMGKTIQTISLILTDAKPGSGNMTLVVAPTVAIMQWKHEFEKFTTGFKINVWHGGSRSSDVKEMKKFDIVLTSYAVLESSFRRQNSGYRRKGELLKEPSVLHKLKWHRVILDEAHNIKDRACNTAKGAFALQSKYRWCLSGTPLQNRVGELYSLIRFLGADPFSYYFCKRCDCKALHWMFSNKRTCDECGHSPMNHICFWNNDILKPIQKYGASEGTHGATAFSKLRVLLDRMMLRRTKLERADDLGLPPRMVEVRRDYFTEEEEELYTSLYSDVRRQFSNYADAGTILNNYANLFQLITRMRQMANHPDLVLKSKTAQDISRQITSNSESLQTCRVCLDEAEDAVISRCRHIFCRECIRQYLESACEQEPECPVCHLPISIDLSQDALEDAGQVKARQGILDRLDPGKWRTSTKIEALVEELNKAQAEDHTIKSIVFSQFTTMLDLVERRLMLAGFKTARLQGSMTPEARDRTIRHFMDNTHVTVFLISLKAGGVALNLTEASRCWILDPWWNPAVELQAMDRIHRIGQHRPVQVTRFIIENSIESRIVELQKKKEAMTGAALGDDDSAMGRLSPEDFGFLFSL